MKLIFENWRKFLGEDLGSAMRGTLAGIAGLGRMPVPADNLPKRKNFEPGGDLKYSVKAVLHRNGLVLLLKNEKGWDLPGGHVRQGENNLSALSREVFEETGLNINNIQDLNIRKGNKMFFIANFLTDDVTLSSEHHQHGFFKPDEILKLRDISDDYCEVINNCLDKI